MTSSTTLDALAITAAIQSTVTTGKVARRATKVNAGAYTADQHAWLKRERSK